MSEATLTKIQNDVSWNSLHNLCFLASSDLFVQCAKLEAEIQIYKKSEPIGTACDA